VDNIGNIDENVIKYIDEDLKSTPEFQKQIEDFQKQLDEEREFKSSIASAIFSLSLDNSNKEYRNFEKQQEGSIEFIATQIKDGVSYAEARKQWLQTLTPFKQKVEEIALSETEERKSYLQRREAELSALEAEEKTIDEAEALIDKQNAKEGQNIGE
jgi:hypothetical protein